MTLEDIIFDLIRRHPAHALGIVIAGWLALAGIADAWRTLRR